MPPPTSSCGTYYCSDGTWQYTFPILCGYKWDSSPARFSACGDGVVDEGEECDDANTLAGDGCGSLCQIEANWECPEAGRPCIPGCAADGGGCASPLCSALDAGEACDGGGTGICGDGITSGLEECDDGPANTAVYGEAGCTASCSRAHRCGDSILDAGQGEECDWGDKNGTDLWMYLTGGLRGSCGSDCKIQYVVN